MGPTRRARFETDLAPMMYGFGGDDKPVKESVDLLSDMVTGFITRVTHEGVNAARLRGDSTLNLDCLLYAFRSNKNARKRARIEELLTIHKEIKEVRARLDTQAQATADESKKAARLKKTEQ